MAKFTFLLAAWATQAQSAILAVPRPSKWSEWTKTRGNITIFMVRVGQPTVTPPCLTCRNYKEAPTEKNPKSLKISVRFCKGLKTKKERFSVQWAGVWIYYWNQTLWLKVTEMEKSQGWQQSRKGIRVKSHYLEKGKDSEARQSIQNSNRVMLMWKTVAYWQCGFSNTKTPIQAAGRENVSQSM